VRVCVAVALGSWVLVEGAPGFIRLLRGGGPFPVPWALDREPSCISWARFTVAVMEGGCTGRAQGTRQASVSAASGAD
jgi:hypothetical protein